MHQKSSTLRILHTKRNNIRGSSGISFALEETSAASSEKAAFQNGKSKCRIELAKCVCADCKNELF